MEFKEFSLHYTRITKDGCFAIDQKDILPNIQSTPILIVEKKDLHFIPVLQKVEALKETNTGPSE